MNALYHGRVSRPKNNRAPKFEESVTKLTRHVVYSNKLPATAGRGHQQEVGDPGSSWRSR